MINTGWRKVMVEFHNSPLIKGIASEFNAAEFAAVLKESYVDTIILYVKCHHGMAYYNTVVGTKHPHLDSDLLGEVTEACHAEGIKVQAFYSVGCDEEAASGHPEWLQLGKDGQEKCPPEIASWRPVCINTPYVEELLLPQVREILEGYEVDALWFDIIALMGDGCYCPCCREKMRGLNLDITSGEDRETFIQKTNIDFLKKTSGFIREISPDIDIIFNNQNQVGVRQVLPYLTHLDIEQPFFWGLGHLAFTLDARHLATLGISYSGIAGTYHSQWADYGGLANPDQIRYQVAAMLANGGSCEIIPPMHPTGRMEKAHYDLIKTAYSEVKDSQEWCEGASPLAQVAILADPQKVHREKDESLCGIAKILIETQHQFHILDYESELSDYEVIILPNNRKLSAAEIDKLRCYLSEGGAVLATHLASYDSAREDFLLEHLGVKYSGESPYSVGYLRLAGEQIQKGIPTYDYVVYDRFVNIEPGKDTEILSLRIDPYFERTPEHFNSHAQAPPGKESIYPAIVRNGKVIYIAPPLFKAYFQHGNTVYRKITQNCLDMLVPRKMVIAEVNSSVEVTVTRQGNRFILHLVNYHTAKKGGAPGRVEGTMAIGSKEGRTVEVIESIPPLFDIVLKMRLQTKPQKVYLAPSREPLRFQMEDGYIKVVIPRLDIHQMVVFE